MRVPLMQSDFVNPKYSNTVSEAKIKFPNSDNPLYEFVFSASNYQDTRNVYSVRINAIHAPQLTIRSHSGWHKIFPFSTIDLRKAGLAMILQDDGIAQAYVFTNVAVSAGQLMVGQAYIEGKTTVASFTKADYYGTLSGGALSTMRAASKRRTSKQSPRKRSPSKRTPKAQPQSAEAVRKVGCAKQGLARCGGARPASPIRRRT